MISIIRVRRTDTREVRRGGERGGKRGEGRGGEGITGESSFLRGHVDARDY